MLQVTNIIRNIEHIVLISIVRFTNSLVKLLYEYYILFALLICISGIRCNLYFYGMFFFCIKTSNIFKPYFLSTRSSNSHRALQIFKNNNIVILTVSIYYIYTYIQIVTGSIVFTIYYEYNIL